MSEENKTVDTYCKIVEQLLNMAKTNNKITIKQFVDNLKIE